MNMPKNKKKAGIFRRLFGRERRERDDLLVEAGRASAQAMREYRPVFEELARHDKQK